MAYTLGDELILRGMKNFVPTLPSYMHGGGGRGGEGRGGEGW